VVVVRLITIRHHHETEEAVVAVALVEEDKLVRELQDKDMVAVTKINPQVAVVAQEEGEQLVDLLEVAQEELVFPTI
jgi:hypothetical protein